MKEKKFRVLRLIGTLYKAIGIIVGLIAILSAVVMIIVGVFGGDVLGNWTQMLPNMQPAYPGQPAPDMAMNAFAGITMAVMGLLWGLLIAIMLYGAGELMYLYIAVEENTRITARLLQNKPLE